MATAQEIIESAFSKIGVLGAGETLSAEDAATGLRLLNMLIESWSLDNLLVYDAVQVSRALTAGTASFSIGPSGDVVGDRPIAILGGYVRVSGYDYPIDVVDREQYNALSDKTNGSSWPGAVYYEASMPNGRVYLLPVVGSDCTIYLDTQTVLASFASTGTSVSLPPGYQRALEYGLAVEAAPDFSVRVPESVARLAAAARSQLKTANVQVPVVDTAARIRDATSTQGSDGGLPAVWRGPALAQPGGDRAAARERLLRRAEGR